MKKESRGGERRRGEEGGVKGRDDGGMRGGGREGVIAWREAGAVKMRKICRSDDPL